MRTVFFIISLLAVTVLHGQKDTLSENHSLPPIHSDNRQTRLCVKFAPLSLLGIYTGPSLRLGVEYKIKDSWSLYNEFGYFFADKRGALLKLELKHYLYDFDNNDRNSGGYLSGELYYKYQYFNASDSIEILPKYEKDYSVSKHVECLTLKLGYMKVYRCGIVVDMFCGLGVRVKQAQNTLTSEENAHIAHSSDYGPNVFVNEAGNKVYPNIDLGVKVGYRFR
jgi:hypothetical protein